MAEQLSLDASFRATILRWACHTCQQLKSNMNPHDFAIWQRLWREREARRKPLEPLADPPPTLFGGG